MKIKIQFLYLLVLVFSVFSARANNLLSDEASLSGFVKAEETEETLIGASVYIPSVKKGAYTNKSGFFSITGIPAGEYVVKISSVGFAPIEKKLIFKKNRQMRETFFLTENSVTTGEVSVEADREVEKREISISKINIPVKQIKEIRIAGESDVFRTLQLLPGVLTSSQISSGLYIRGGSPDQNLVLIDGSTVYNPSHLFGFISTFNSDAIKDVELIKGGYPAEYGSRLSSVINITQKDGNRNRVEGIGSIGLISSKLSLNGPIGKGSWFVGGRR
ncbi:MAG: TonB-dependent receptor, partial [Ignavibacteria bacterium]|nr:TonB-dependent receptor [Ignavibacteria bacterium]